MDKSTKNNPDGLNNPDLNFDDDTSIPEEDKEDEKIRQINPQIKLDQFSIKPEDIIEDSEPSVLRMITMNQCLEEANKLLIPNQLFADIWYEGEVCI